MKLKRPSIGKGWTVEKLTKKIRAGHGKGELSSYQPWISIRDLSSRGTSTRLYSPKTGRVMEFLSNVERDTFLIAEFRPDFVDYWEQYPLEPHLTDHAAQQLGYRHPVYPGTSLQAVMTVDAVLTLRQDAQLVRKAIDCKHSSDLANHRTHEKLAIARLACEARRLPHILVTEQHTPAQLVRNILWSRIALPKRGEVELFEGALDILPMRIHRHLLELSQAGQLQDTPITQYCKAFDISQALPTGTCLRCFKLLVWHHLVTLDMQAREVERLPLSQVNVMPAPKVWRLGAAIRTPMTQDCSHD